MPVVCRKIAYGQAGALQPISELCGSATVESKSQSFLVSRFMRHRTRLFSLRAFYRALRRTFERRLQ